VAGAAAGQRRMGVAEEGLGQGEDGVRADAGRVVRAAGGQDADRADPEVRQKLQRLILDHIRKRADDQQLARLGFGSTGTIAARQASSPWVKVVSMPLPE
jgi:hypothetical protein